ncbi:hypothetical protein DPMN_021201 [Dreissena polymorpha]|uniref:Uncharacterized protein n=1 Tax=Dreissena polymorpha TaxID=45954 RepID=A0A9D4SBL6_DREPO|nr:hypothetical protein DPMN_021201 [Dreissena polymorpha]
MPPGSEIQCQLEAIVPKTILSTRTATTICTWNVLTMYKTWKPAQVAAEMRKYDLTIIGISESR